MSCDDVYGIFFSKRLFFLTDQHIFFMHKVKTASYEHRALEKDYYWKGIKSGGKMWKRKFDKKQKQKSDSESYTKRMYSI